MLFNQYAAVQLKQLIVSCIRLPGTKNSACQKMPKSVKERLNNATQYYFLITNDFTAYILFLAGFICKRSHSFLNTRYTTLGIQTNQSSMKPFKKCTCVPHSMLRILVFSRSRLLMKSMKIGLSTEKTDAESSLVLKFLFLLEIFSTRCLLFYLHECPLKNQWKRNEALVLLW